jgi:hypothetical protein
MADKQPAAQAELDIFQVPEPAKPADTNKVAPPNYIQQSGFSLPEDTPNDAVDDGGIPDLPPAPADLEKQLEPEAPPPTVEEVKSKDKKELDIFDYDVLIMSNWRKLSRSYVYFTIVEVVPLFIFGVLLGANTLVKNLGSSHKSEEAYSIICTKSRNRNFGGYILIGTVPLLYHVFSTLIYNGLPYRHLKNIPPGTRKSVRIMQKNIISFLIAFALMIVAAGFLGNSNALEQVTLADSSLVSIHPASYCNPLATIWFFVHLSMTGVGIIVIFWYMIWNEMRGHGSFFHCGGSDVSSSASGAGGNWTCNDCCNCCDLVLDVCCRGSGDCFRLIADCCCGRRGPGGPGGPHGGPHHHGGCCNLCGGGGDNKDGNCCDGCDKCCGQDCCKCENCCGCDNVCGDCCKCDSCCDHACDDCCKVLECGGCCDNCDCGGCDCGGELAGCLCQCLLAIICPCG